MPADPTRKGKLLALAERAEAGGDDDLSYDIWIALGWTPGDLPFWKDPEGKIVGGPRPYLVHSIDAQEAVGPRINDARGAIDSCWIATAANGDAFGSGIASTEALARLAAKLRTLAGMETPDGE